MSEPKFHTPECVDEAVKLAEMLGWGLIFNDRIHNPKCECPCHQKFEISPEDMAKHGIKQSNGDKK